MEFGQNIDAVLISFIPNRNNLYDKGNLLVVFLIGWASFSMFAVFHQ